MPLVPIQLPTRSNVARNSAVGNTTLINCYADPIGQDAKAATPIYACDGWASFATLSTGGTNSPVRGMLNLDDTLLWVLAGEGASNWIDSITTDGTRTSRGSITTAGYAYFARNRAATPNIMLVTSDGVTRTISGTTVSTPSYDPAIGASDFNSVCCMDGYFVISKTNGEFYISGLDAVTIDPLDFAKASSVADGLSRAVVRGRDLVLMGDRSTEFWQNTGQADFPFQRVHVANYGLYNGPAAVATMAAVDSSMADTVIFPATTPDGGYAGVVMLAGYEVRRISTWEVDNAVRTAIKANVRAYCYPSQGQTFYAITDNATFSYEYNTRTGAWHQRQSSGLSFSRICDATVFNNKVILGDYATSRVYQLSTSATPSGTSKVMVQKSRDNGDTWEPSDPTLYPNRCKSLGTSGQRKTRTKFTRFGESKEDGFNIKLTITSAFVEGSNDIDMTIIPPSVHAQPYPVQMHTLYVDAIPGVSGTANQRGMIMLHADITTLGG